MNVDAAAKSYPGNGEVDAWLDSIWDLVDTTTCQVELLVDQGFTHNLGIRHTPGFQYVQFTPTGMSRFYGYWQPAVSLPSPLLVHVPGYGAEMSAHPDLVAAGFNVLHISPLGYSTPTGADETKKRDDQWPVFPDTILSEGKKGYREWLANCAIAIRWALDQPECENRISFFGSSQGGGGALLLASLYKDRGVRCVAADVPFLINFLGGAQGRGAYRLFSEVLRLVDDEALAWHTAGLIDTLSHVHRLNLPVLLTAGGSDETCPPDTIEALFDRLPGTRSYTYLKDVGHRYTTQFIPLASAWFRLHA